MTKEDLPKTLQPYWNHEFSSGGTTGQDYKQFQAKYRNWLRKELSGYSVTLLPNHYEFSAVIEKPAAGAEPARYVYLSISDVRAFPRQWATRILVRTMRHAKDWTGGYNNYCGITGVRDTVDRLMQDKRQL